MKTSRSFIFALTAMLIMAVLFGGASSLAQDAADPITTVEGAPFAIVTEEAAAPVTCQEGATCIVNEAPDEGGGNDTPANSVPTPVVIAGAVILGGFFLLFLYNQRQVNELLAKAIPAEAVPALIDAALPTITTLIMNTVAKVIPTEIDDKLFIQAASDRGLTVVKDDITGDYQTARKPVTAAIRPIAPYPPSTGTPLGTELTTSKTDTLPSHPSDGGASGGGTGFPPVR